MEKDFGTKLESIKHIGDMVDGKMVCRENCPSDTHKTPEAECKCELDGFQGAVSTEHCKVHGNTPKIEGGAYSRGYKQGRFDADMDRLNKEPATPDTEGEKEELVRKAERDIEFVVSNPDMYDISVQVKNIVRNLLSSRDTYWKERVQKALKTVAYREVTVRGGMYSDDKYRGPNEEVIRLVKMQDVELVLGITNEDNLK